MPELWYAAFGLLSLLSILNAAVLVGVMRQVGVLHERIRPTGPGYHEGPEIGTRLPRLTFTVVSGDIAPDPFVTPITLLAFVSPGCGLCEALTQQVVAYRRVMPREAVQVALVTDASADAAGAWAQEHNVRAPLLCRDDVTRTYLVPGSPYVVAAAVDLADPTLVRVLGRGVVNTLEQFEDLVESAQDVLSKLYSDTPGGTNQEVALNNALPMHS